MTAQMLCPQCGNSMPVASPGGVCPKCLLAAGIESRSQGYAPTFDSPRSEAFVPPSPAELEARFPQLEILELLGRGGMGAVYKARQRGLNRIVALKILPPEVGRDPSFADRFLREGHALAKLNHPNIVAVYDSGVVDGLYYFIMEFVDGINLRQTIKSGSLRAQDALAVVPQICDALQYAHDQGVVHRDIKPENILLDRSGRVKIADFGLARLLGQADASLTHTHQVMGTLRYMAPEQMEGMRAVDHRADIFSLGVVFYELLTGELPLGRFAPPSKKVQVDVRLDEVVLRALEREPDLRYQQVSQVKTDMEAIYEHLPPALRYAMGYEYKSKTTLLGVPLVHIATGIDPRTGRKRIAKGIVAMGDIAIGVLAMGGMAIGGITLGGGSFGLFSLGGFSIGVLVALGGAAISAGFSVGGLAIGTVAFGGMAIGVYAIGGGALGAHTVSGAGIDPAARKLLTPWAIPASDWLLMLSVFVPAATILVSFLGWLTFAATRSNPQR